MLARLRKMKNSPEGTKERENRKEELLYYCVGKHPDVYFHTSSSDDLEIVPGDSNTFGLHPFRISSVLVSSHHLEEVELALGGIFLDVPPFPRLSLMERRLSSEGSSELSELLLRTSDVNSSFRVVVVRSRVLGRVEG